MNQFDHPPHETHTDPECERASGWSIAFVRAGSFAVEAQGERRALSAGGVFLTHPGLEFRCTHDERCPTDVCVSVNFDSAAIAEQDSIWQTIGWVTRESATPRLAYVNARLMYAGVAHDHFEIERWGLAALTALSDDARTPTRRGPYAVRGHDLDVVVASCRTIEANPTEQRSIADRARAVGVRSTQLTRAFRRYAGVSPHQFVVQRRLLFACELLASGLTVSDSCYRAGFENLSHFCRAFQRTFNVRASRWRSLSPREMRRKVQAVNERRV